MAPPVVRRRRDGVLEIAPPRRVRWVLYGLAGLFVSVPLVLAMFVLLPPVVFAVPVMTLWVAVWVVFRRLDVPRIPR